MSRRDRAARLNEKGGKLEDKGRFAQAIDAYRQAVSADPAWAVPWYNLGLAYKRQRRWEESLEANGRAAALDPADEAAWWNLGIAATALGRWAEARAAWRGFGIDVPDGDGPLDLPCGFCPIRLDPAGQAEVVWANRLDPARARLASIPFPESGHRWQDVVLNDGAPNGYRRYEGKEVPVFDALQLLQPSRFGTYVARVMLPPRSKSPAALAEVAARAGGAAEDWSTSVRVLCRACSEGRPHDLHDREAAPPSGARLIGIAARSRDQADAILETWLRARTGITVEALDEALEPGATPG